MNVPLDKRILTGPTLIRTIETLIELKNKEVQPDDIDHLGNRRVRSVGELLQNQFRIAMSRAEKTARDRMNIYDLESIMPHNLINAKLVSSINSPFPEI